MVRLSSYKLSVNYVERIIMYLDTMFYKITQTDALFIGIRILNYVVFTDIIISFIGFSFDALFSFFNL